MLPSPSTKIVPRVLSANCSVVVPVETVVSADAVLSSLIAGRVTGLSVDVGDQVKAGQVVARIEDPALAAGTREAQAAVASAQAELTSAGLARVRLQKLVDQGIAARCEHRITIEAGRISQ